MAKEFLPSYRLLGLFISCMYAEVQTIPFTSLQAGKFLGHLNCMGGCPHSSDQLTIPCHKQHPQRKLQIWRILLHLQFHGIPTKSVNDGRDRRPQIFASIHTIAAKDCFARDGHTHGVGNDVNCQAKHQFSGASFLSTCFVGVFVHSNDEVANLPNILTLQFILVEGSDAAIGVGCGVQLATNDSNKEHQNEQQPLMQNSLYWWNKLDES